MGRSLALEPGWVPEYYSIVTNMKIQTCTCLSRVVSIPLSTFSEDDASPLPDAASYMEIEKHIFQNNLRSICYNHPPKSLASCSEPDDTISAIAFAVCAKSW